MSELTSKQEKFCQLIADGKNQSDAYRSAFNSNAKPESVNQMASRLFSEVNISSRVRELQSAISEANLWSRIDSLKVLAEIANGEDLDAKPGDKISAVKAINQMNGWDKQIIDHQSSDGTMSPKDSSDAVLAAIKSKYESK